MPSASKPTPFHISISDAKINDILTRVANYPWPSRAREAEMNKLPHYTASIDGQTIHFIHVRGSGDAYTRPPLLLIHGWPYSFWTYADLVPMLAPPERFAGGTNSYAFSSPPAAGKPIGPRRVAQLFDSLMTEGSFIASMLGFHHAGSCEAVHLTMLSVRHWGAPAKSGVVPDDDDETGEEERRFVEREMRVWGREGAYAKVQSTKPGMLGWAMAESAVGVAAWVVEALHAWTDLMSLGGRGFEEVWGVERVLDEVMLYLVADSFGTSTWIYVGEFEEGEGTLPKDEEGRQRRVEVPMGVMAFPDPVFPMAPRAVVERSYRV
ncbi:hypothetical protein LTS18_007684, partial [Coniosporium uncinatum]